MSPTFSGGRRFPIGPHLGEATPYCPSTGSGRTGWIAGEQLTKICLRGIPFEWCGSRRMSSTGSCAGVTCGRWTSLVAPEGIRLRVAVRLPHSGRAAQVVVSRRTRRQPAGGEIGEVPFTASEDSSGAWSSLGGGDDAAPRRERTGGLNWWAWCRTVRAEDTAVARLRAQNRSAARALVEKLAGVGRHHFFLRGSTGWTRDRGCSDHRGLSSFVFTSCAPRRGACGTAHVGTPRRGSSHT